VFNLVHRGLVRSHRIEEVLLTIDRKNYVPPVYDDKTLSIQQIYSDLAQGLSHNATISAPHIHGLTLDLLEPHVKKGGIVVDVGCGSGYVTACLATLVGESGQVIGIDHESDLVTLASSNISHGNPDLLPRIKFTVGDALDELIDSILGISEYNNQIDGSGVDAIMVGAAAESIKALGSLLRLLRPGGGMLVPVGPAGGFHKTLLITRHERDIDGEEFKFVNYGTVRFVPLQSRQEQANADVFSAPIKVMNIDGVNRVVVKSLLNPAPDMTPDDYRQMREDLRRYTSERPQQD